MRNYKIILRVFISAIFLLSGFKERKKVNVHPEDKWSGIVTFHEKKTGPKIIRSDWWMIATINNNVGNALDSSVFENTDGDKARCAKREKTELDLGLDEQTREYDITIAVPGCYGTKTDRYGKTDSFGLCDETAIIIERQKQGADHNVLSGQITIVDGPDANGNKTVTVHEWNLKKSN
jgi:hypothetical protein